MVAQRLIVEDTGSFDLTTLGLGIGMLDAKIEFRAAQGMRICGIEYVCEIMEQLCVSYVAHANDGDDVSKGELLFEAKSSAAKLHKAWKISQNTLEYLSGIATYTRDMVQKAQTANSHAKVVTTRKNFPTAKEMSLKAVIAGGAFPHRLGLYDSLLVFEEHLGFFETQEELESAFCILKEKFLEKKVVVEVESFEKARYFALLGADVLQCEKMSFEELCRCVALKKEFPNVLVSATGGVKLENVATYAACGVDLIVTSAPYHAKPLDVKVKITKESVS